MLKAGARFAFAGAALVHFRPRERLRSLFWQYYFYARGDAVAGLWPRRHAIRYATYFTGLGLALFGGPGWVLLGLGMLVYCRRPWQRVIRRRHEGYTSAQSFFAAGLVPLVRVTGDIAKMLGYAAGWVRLWRNPALRRERDAWAAQYL